MTFYCSGHYVILFLVKILNADFLTGTICGVKDTGVCLTAAYRPAGENKRKQTDIVPPLPPKVDLGNSCP